MYGYRGKVLRVDLTSGKLQDAPLAPSEVRDFIGGSGLAAHLYLKEIASALQAAGPPPSAPSGRIGPKAGYPDPLGPENPLLVMTGPLTGTSLPCSSRFTVSARSPLTGIWGEANVGGFFGPELKLAGYDGLIVTGRAAEPVYLLVASSGPRLQPAGDLWGLDAYDADDLLTARHGADAAGRRPRTLVIGPAGENRVRFAAVVHGKHHVAGRTGMGAVMGAKNLKAVVAVGSRGTTGPAAADPEAVKRLTRSFAARAAEKMVTRSLGEAGTIMGMDIGALIGDVPIKNWSLGDWDDRLERVGVGEYMNALTAKATCYACPVGCKRVVTTEALGRRLSGAPGAEYETVACLGPNLLIDDLPAVLVAGEACNRLGLDTITTGATLAYAYEAADRGLLTAPELHDGWGDSARLLELIAAIASRRGIGDRLAEGSELLAASIGGPEAGTFLSTVKGLEAPAHDPRAAHGMGVAYAASTRGACHMNSLMYGSEHAGFSAPEAGVDSDGLQPSSVGKGLLAKAAEDLGGVFGQSAVLCQLGGNMYDAADLVAMLEAVTGLGLSLDEVLVAGARIWHLKRAIGNLYGVRREDDRLPDRLTRARTEGGAAGSAPDLEGMLAEWYTARGLDESGLARPEVLEELGLGRVARLLRPEG